MNKTKTFLRYNLWILILDIVAFGLSYLLALYVRFIGNARFGRLKARQTIIYGSSSDQIGTKIRGLQTAVSGPSFSDRLFGKAVFR